MEHKPERKQAILCLRQSTPTLRTQHNALSVPLWVPRNTFSKEGFSYRGGEPPPQDIDLGSFLSPASPNHYVKPFSIRNTENIFIQGSGCCCGLTLADMEMLSLLTDMSMLSDAMLLA